MKALLSTTGTSRWGSRSAVHSLRGAKGGGDEGVISRTTTQQVLVEMRKSREAVTRARISLAEVNCSSRSLKSSSGRKLQGCSPQQGAVAWMQDLPSLSTRKSLTCCQRIYRNFFCFLNAVIQVHRGQPRLS